MRRAAKANGSSVVSPSTVRPALTPTGSTPAVTSTRIKRNDAPHTGASTANTSAGRVFIMEQ